MLIQIQYVFNWKDISLCGDVWGTDGVTVVTDGAAAGSEVGFREVAGGCHGKQKDKN